MREETERNCLPHGSISGGRGMQVISAIEGGEKVVRMLRVAHNTIEVDDGVKVAGGTNPGVDRLAVSLAERTWMVII